MTRGEKMARMYAEGLTLAQVGDKMGVSRQAVQQMLKRMNVPRRDRNEGRRRDE